MLLQAVVCSCLLLASAYRGPDLPPGPYCGGVCCDGRVDECSHSILGTRCYCDVFCMRNGTKHDDCCPDYNADCTDEPPEQIISCEHDNVYYFKGQKRMDNCNECICTATTDALSTEWECTRDPCIVSADVLEAVRQQRRGWTASNYTQFWGRKLSDGLKLKLGTLPLSETTLRMRADPSYYAETLRLPAAFDSRAQWPGFISRVRDQGWCGADWAVSTADVASDRFSIQSKGAENVRLSAQQLLTCATKRQQGCGGGHIDRAWTFLRKNGLVDEPCFPYVGTNPWKQCPNPTGTLSSAGCQIPPSGRAERYHTSPPKRLGSTHDIMYEIMNSGPVQAVMKVCQDFFVYREGIYRHVPTPHSSEELCGLHAVRILGWGEDGGDKYWLVANSWGAEWGEGGYFRIALGENESKIEHFVLAALANVFEVGDARRK